MPRSEVAEQRGLRVLVVDDDAVNLIVSKELVRELGYRVDTAVNGAEAAQMVLEQGDFAAVLMDCQMPVMDGYDATRTIRAGEPAGRHTPIIALTAHAFANEAQKVADAGMDGYLCKPVRTEQLRATLRAHILGDGCPGEDS